MGRRYATGQCYHAETAAALHYFERLFAQVTNPPIDPIRGETGEVSLHTVLGWRRNLLFWNARALPPDHPQSRRYCWMQRSEQLAAIGGEFPARTIPASGRFPRLLAGLENAIHRICRGGQRMRSMRAFA